MEQGPSHHALQCGCIGAKAQVPAESFTATVHCSAVQREEGPKLQQLVGGREGGERADYDDDDDALLT